MFEINISHTDNLIREDLEEVFKKRRSTIMVLPSISRLVISTSQKIDGCWLAGGAALALYTGNVVQIKDWDLFFRSLDCLNHARSVFENLGFKYKNSSDWSVTYELAGVDVQFVMRHYYNNVDDIFKKFDFTICCFALDGNYLCYTPEAKRDEEKKEFNFIHTDNIHTCIKRIARYGAKGYFPSTQFVNDISKVFKKTPVLEFKKMKAAKQS